MSDFWKHVEKSAEPNGCWIWTGHRIKRGYGDFQSKAGGKNRHTIAHRWAWADANGPIPDGLLVLHRCDNPPCVNPSHLFLGTHQDNSDDMIKKGRQSKRKGEQSPLARIGPEEVEEIRRLVNEVRLSRSKVGKQFGLCHQSVGKIASGIAWAHISLRSPPWTGRAKSTGRPKAPTQPAGFMRCGRCKSVLPAEEFHPSSVIRGSGYCRPCSRGCNRAQYAQKRIGK